MTMQEIDWAFVKFPNAINCKYIDDSEYEEDIGF